jgi:hypothetical protein
METLFAGECGSYLYQPQEFEVYLYLARSEYEAKKWLELIKDYELEVHYHPGKANVVSDALSRKGHCNYLPAVHSTGEESST